MKDAESTLAPFGADTAILKDAARFIAERRAWHRAEAQWPSRQSARPG